LIWFFYLKEIVDLKLHRCKELIIGPQIFCINSIYSFEGVQELRMARDRCQTLTADLERSKADNVKLYEKMRFVQDYSQDRPSKGRSGKKVLLDAGFFINDIFEGIFVAQAESKR